MIIVACDPGRVTSYAVFDTQKPYEISVGEFDLIGSGRLLRPCPIHISQIVSPADQVVVEEVGARPKQGSSAIFSFGLAVGAVLNSAGAHGKPLVLVTPPEWKRASRLGNFSEDSVKEAARSYAFELWPDLKAQIRSKSQHGMAEAALMARWFFLKGPGRDVDIEDGSPMRAA